jgi:spermidine synthase
VDDTAVVGKATTGILPVSSARLFSAVFVMSLGSLLLELSITRLFSVILFYHFAFLAVSIALLGLGAGGVFAYIFKNFLRRYDLCTLGAAIAIFNAGIILAVLWSVVRIPVSLHVTGTNFLRLTAIYLLTAIPFFFTGLLFSVIFARETRRIGPLYGADLIGGAAACLVVVPLLNHVGGPNTIVFAAFTMAVAAMIWATKGRVRAQAAALALAVVTLLAANNSGKLIDIIYAKGYYHRGDWIKYARWNAISRIEVDHWNGGDWITIDADASTAIMNSDPHLLTTAAEKNLMYAAPAVANVLRPTGSFAIIGPGGGVDVLRAVVSGSPSVTGIEINPLIADNIMRGAWADYSHHLYQIPEVHMHVSDGRSWVRNSRDSYDVLQMTLVDTWASTAAGAFALSENNLYTVQAFREYFQHLEPDGMVAITRWEFKRPREALRVASVAMQALHELGVADTRQNFIVVAQQTLDLDGVPVTVLAKKSAFTEAETQQVRRYLGSHPPLTALYLPDQPSDNPYGRLIAANDPVSFARTYEFNVRPVTDNAPFFFFTMKLGDMFGNRASRSIDWKVNVGVAVLFMLLVISVLAVIAFLILPLWKVTGRRPNSRPLYYFIAIGLGYILVEIAFIQRFVLFLGHPTYALTVVVFLMLLSSGAGSIVSRKWLPNPTRVRELLAVLVVVLLGYVVVLPLILGSLVGLPFAAKLLVSSVLLVPLGFIMGMPFPVGLRALHGAGEDTVEWAWAMNAASSVLGSVLAMTVAIQFGLNVTLACAALAYLSASLLAVRFRRDHIADKTAVHAEQAA